MAGKYICIRKCYYLQKLWDVGEQLWDDAPPNKHFAIDGVVKDDNSAGPQMPGDDPRSTQQIRIDLERLLQKPFKADATRKELFWAWKAASQPKQPAPKETEAYQPKQDGNPILKKLFSDMTPDDIDGISAKEIVGKLKGKPYFLENVKPTGISKADLVKRGIAIEDQIKINASQ